MAERTNDPGYGDRHGAAGDPHDFRHTPDERPRVAPLSELSDFKVAENEPDIRGWKVRSSDGREIGKIKDLIGDTGAMKIRYLDVSLDKKALNLKDDRRVLIPIGAARLNDDDDVVVINRPSVDLASLPEYEGKGFNREYEDRLRSSWGRSGTSSGAGSDYYDTENFNDREFFGRRREGRENAEYFTRDRGL